MAKDKARTYKSNGRWTVVRVEDGKVTLPAGHVTDGTQVLLIGFVLDANQFAPKRTASENGNHTLGYVAGRQGELAISIPGLPNGAEVGFNASVYYS